jgi:hypothetical protein
MLVPAIQFLAGAGILVPGLQCRLRQHIYEERLATSLNRPEIFGHNNFFNQARLF